MEIKINKGLDIPIAGKPRQEIEDLPLPSRVALLGYDYVGVKKLPSLEIEVGDRVKRGQALYRGKAYPEVVGTAPVAGVVEAVHRGHKRVIETIVIRTEGDEEETFESYAPEELGTLDREQVQRNLLASGLWLGLRTRPYTMVALPDQHPEALFVTAIDTNPLAPDPQVAIGQAREDFLNGLIVLSKLTTGTTWVCTAPGAQIPTPAAANIKAREFAGPHPAGLVGTHIHFLHPVNVNRLVWHVGYQEVIAAGRLFTTGKLVPERVISLAGPGVKDPRLLRTLMGASTNDLVLDNIDTRPELRVISGSILNGKHAVGYTAFLGRFHNQISVLEEGRQREFLAWVAPGKNKFSATRAFVSSLLGNRVQFPLHTSRNGSRRALVPIGTLEDVMPLDILPTQLLLALLVDDTERAEALGCLELDEEDLALCSFADTGKHDFGPILRRNLRAIWKETR
jgi:Na+-transporting NADH:ubiquinone oxidoreductase subunit A